MNSMQATGWCSPGADCSKRLLDSEFPGLPLTRPMLGMFTRLFEHDSMYWITLLLPHHNYICRMLSSIISFCIKGIQFHFAPFKICTSGGPASPEVLIVQPNFAQASFCTAAQHDVNMACQWSLHTFSIVGYQKSPFNAAVSHVQPLQGWHHNCCWLALLFTPRMLSPRNFLDWQDCILAPSSSIAASWYLLKKLTIYAAAFGMRFILEAQSQQQK